MEDPIANKPISETTRSELISSTATGYSDRDPTVGISHNNPMRSIDSNIEGSYRHFRAQRNVTLTTDPTNGEQLDVFRLDPASLMLEDEVLESLFKNHERWRCTEITIDIANAERFSEAAGALKCSRWLDPLTSLPQEGAETLKFVASLPGSRYVSPRTNSTVVYNHDAWKFTNDDPIRDPYLFSYPPVLTTLTTAGSNPGLSLEFMITGLFEFDHPLKRPETTISFTDNFESSFISATITLNEDPLKSTIELTYDNVVPPSRDLPVQVGILHFSPPFSATIDFPTLGPVHQLFSQGEYDPLSGTVTMPVSDKYIIPPSDASSDSASVDIVACTYVSYYAQARKRIMPHHRMNNFQALSQALMALRSFKSVNAKLRFANSMSKLVKKFPNK